MNVLELFAGAGGGILHWIADGHRVVGAVESEPYCQRVLSARMADGSLPWFPVYGDVCAFDGRPYRGVVDCVSGGFPCQDISSAGKGAGIDGARSGLWSEFVRVVREVGPLWWFVENSPMLTSRGLGRVLSDMAALGYDAEWCVLGAKDVGAPHKRNRIWILAHADSDREHVRAIDEEMALPCSPVADARRRRHGRQNDEIQAGQATFIHGGQHASDPDGQHGKPGPAPRGTTGQGRQDTGGCGPWPAEPALDRVAHGLADRVGQLRALGNGQVPQCAALAFRTLRARLMPETTGAPEGESGAS